MGEEGDLTEGEEDETGGWMTRRGRIRKRVEGEGAGQREVMMRSVGSLWDALESPTWASQHLPVAYREPLRNQRRMPKAYNIRRIDVTRRFAFKAMQ
eukprot:6556402-Pyramimonas_sp.AAC.1